MSRLFKVLVFFLGVFLVLGAIAVAMVLFFVPAYAHSGPPAPAPALEAAGPGGGLVALKSYTSSLYGYTMRYPATWGLKVDTAAPAGAGKDAEYVTLTPGENMLPTVAIYAQKGVAPFTGYENCDQNTDFQGLKACRISNPAGQAPASELLVFQKGEAHFMIAMQYDDPSSLAEFEQILGQFEFAQKATIKDHAVLGATRRPQNRSLFKQRSRGIAMYPMTLFAFAPRE